ncbi:MAG TPA: alpha/beta hydrolase, partial [Allocoleopsis sp.]
SNLETYAETGQAQTPEVREFFERHAELGQIVQDALTTKIYISEAFLQDTLRSSVGEFVLVKLNELIGSPSWREDLQPLRTALLDAYQDDNSFSILEVIQDLPDEDINLNLSGLEPVYRDVRAFVERIYPALEVAKEFLQDLVCDCQTAPAASESDSTAPSSSSESGSPQSALPGGDRTVLTAQNCNNGTQAHTTQAHTTQVTPVPHSVSTTATAVPSVLAEPARP